MSFNPNEMAESQKHAMMQDASSICGTDCKAIAIYLRIPSVHAIDTGAQTFTVDFVLNVHWHDPKLIAKLARECDADPKDTRMLTPEEEETMTAGIRFDNLCGDLTRKASFLKIGSREKGIVKWELFAVGTFLDPVEARLFPYDVQDFTIRFRLKAIDALVQHGIFICHYPGRIALDNKYVPEWVVHGITTDKGHNHISYDGFFKSWADTLHLNIAMDDNQKPLIGWTAEASFTFFASRKAGYFEINILSMTFIIGALGLASFSIARQETGDRLSFNSTLMLAEVALKFAFADSLPKLPYMTHADTMVYGVFCCLAVLIVGQAVTALLDPNEEIISDKIVSACYTVLMITLQLVFYFTGMRKRKSFMVTRRVEDHKHQPLFKVVTQRFFDSGALEETRRAVSQEKE